MKSVCIFKSIKHSTVCAAHLSQFLSFLPFHINKAGNFWSSLSSLSFLIVSNTVDRVDKMEEWAKTPAMFVRYLMDKRKKDKSYNVKCIYFVTCDFSVRQYSTLAMVLVVCGTCVTSQVAQAPAVRWSSCKIRVLVIFQLWNQLFMQVSFIVHPQLTESCICSISQRVLLVGVGTWGIKLIKQTTISMRLVYT